MRRVFFLARAEVLHIVRDRTTMLQILVVPIVQLLVLVNAATFIVRNTPVYAVDYDRTITSRGLLNRLAASGHFVIIGSGSMQEANERLLDGSVTMVVTIPRNFERSLVRKGRGTLQIVLNAEKGSAAAIVQSYAARIFARYTEELGAELFPTMRTVARPPETSVPQYGAARIDVRTRGWYNPRLDYRHYMVPGVLVALVTLIGTLLSAQSIAREKELGTIEQLNVTPISRTQFIVGKLLPLWVLGFIDLTIGLVVGKLVFDIPMRGSLLLLFGAAAIYLVVALAIGLLISTLVETQQQAMFVTFFVMTAYLLLSGLFTPVDSMAPWVRIVSLFNPVRHFVTVSRAVLVKGAGVNELSQPLLILVAFAVVSLALAVVRYRKTTV